MKPATWLILGASSAVARAFAQQAAAMARLCCWPDVTWRIWNARPPTCPSATESPRPRCNSMRATCSPMPASSRIARHGRAAACSMSSWPSASCQNRRRRMPSPAIAAGMVEANFTGAASVLAALAPVLEAQRGGVVVALGSVAGDRGRKRNFLYGATKAALAHVSPGLCGEAGEVGRSRPMHQGRADRYRNDLGASEAALHGGSAELRRCGLEAFPAWFRRGLPAADLVAGDEHHPIAADAGVQSPGYLTAGETPAAASGAGEMDAAFRAAPCRPASADDKAGRARPVERDDIVLGL